MNHGIFRFPVEKRSIGGYFSFGMMDDRSYMREGAWSAPWWHSATIVLIVVNAAAFLFQQINTVYLGWPLSEYLALRPQGLAHGQVYQLLTFQFLHVGGWHLVFNLLALYLFGKPVEEAIGRARFLEAYFASGVIGGLCQALLGLAIPAHFGQPVMGASAGVFGLITLFALLEPDRTILLWFVVPVRAIYFVWIAAFIAVFFTLVPSSPGYAHAAHLGGILTGAAYLKWFIRADRRLFEWRTRRPPPVQRVELVKAATPRRAFWRRSEARSAEDLPTEEFISREVDPILDKISAHGIHSLTPDERKILEAARRKMTRK